MKRNRILAGVGGLVLVTGCALVAPAAPRATYFPMETHRLWEYRLVELERAQEWPVAVRSRGPQFVPALRRVVVIFDEEYPDQVVPVAFFHSEGFLQSDIGLGSRSGDRTPVLPIATQPMRLMPVAPKVGMRWSYVEDVFGGRDPEEHAFVIDWQGSVHGEETVTVPAGVFPRCIRVESVAVHRSPDRRNGRRYRYRDWYAPEVGLVKSEYAYGAKPRTVTRMELIRFELGSDDRPPDVPDMYMASLAR